MDVHKVFFVVDKLKYTTGIEELSVIVLLPLLPDTPSGTAMLLCSPPMLCFHPIGTAQTSVQNERHTPRLHKQCSNHLHFIITHEQQTYPPS